MKSLKRVLSSYYLVLPGLILFFLFVARLWFIQDDAYITYRYVENYLNGHGLVFNIGERVEGFTNFGWTIVLALIGSLGLPYIALSQIIGMLLGAASIIFIYKITLHATGGPHWAGAAALLFGANQSLAYWSPAGLETAAFIFCACLSFYWFLRGSHLLIWSMLFAVWIRPEGAVVTGILIITEFLIYRKFPLFTLRCAIAALALSLPYVAFKISYYGSLLPNPFYAKTRFDLAQARAGWEYVWEFLSHYALWGGIFILPLFVWRRLNAAAKSVYLVMFFYSLYIFSIGGDVLKVHRFFLPIAGLVGTLWATIGTALLSRRAVQKPWLPYLLAIPLVIFAVVLPWQVITNYNRSEITFTDKQQFLARSMKAADSTNFSVALTTIGIFGYELMGHHIIDMLGLTDSTIARYSEDPIEGMTTTWKERKHNSKYILSREPDYIVFSTSIKPSAPAERALMLYRQFIEGYRQLGWYYENKRARTKGALITAFYKAKPVSGELKPYYPVAFVEYLKLGHDSYVANNHVVANAYYDSALRVSPKPYYVYLIYYKAFGYVMMERPDLAQPLLNEVVRRDSLVYEAHKDLNMLARLYGDTAKAAIHYRWLKKLVPWYVPRHDSVVDGMLEGAKQMGLIPGSKGAGAGGLTGDSADIY